MDDDPYFDCSGMQKLKTEGITFLFRLCVQKCVNGLLWWNMDLLYLLQIKKLQNVFLFYTRCQKFEACWFTSVCLSFQPSATLYTCQKLLGNYAIYESRFSMMNRSDIYFFHVCVCVLFVSWFFGPVKILSCRANPLTCS